jgi:hypothetical protein
MIYFFFSKLNKLMNNLFNFDSNCKIKKSNYFTSETKKNLIKKNDWNLKSDTKINNEYFFEKKIYFKNLYCDPYSGYFFTKFGYPIILEHHFTKKYMSMYHNFLLPFFINKQKIENGIYFGGFFMENYCHFLFYIYVPILVLPKNFTLVFDARLLNQKFFKDFLNIIKKERKYVIINKPTFFKKGLVYQKKYLGKKELDNLSSNIKRNLNNKYQVIYIKRQSQFRNINSDNEKKIISIIRKKYKKIKIINCQKLNFNKQIEIFSNAEFIIGTHGADFANMIFGLKNIKKIVEFSHPSFFTGVYTRISKIYKIEHTQLVGIKSGSNNEYSINLDSLKKII